MGGTAARRLLMLVGDSRLAAKVERVAVSCGVTAVPVTLTDPALGGYHDTVVVDAAAAARLAAQSSRPRRVALVAAEAPDEPVWRLALNVGAQAVAVLPREASVLAGWLVDAPVTRHGGVLLSCLPGRGGAGASTLAASLALAAGVHAGSAMLLDLDPTSGGQDLLLGVERKPGARWSDLSDGLEHAEAPLERVPSVAGVSVLSTDSRAPDRLGSTEVDRIVTAAVSAHPAVVADLPRGHGAATVLARSQLAFVVTTADVRGVAAARRAVSAARTQASDVRVVVRRPSPGDLRPRDVADAVEAPLAAVWPWDRRLGALVDAGAFAARWSRTTAGAVAKELVTELLPEAVA
jgi:secretion/DNA translocation related CpaE-like protein